jgi:hypothetical protein
MVLLAQLTIAQIAKKGNAKRRARSCSKSTLSQFVPDGAARAICRGADRARRQHYVAGALRHCTAKRATSRAFLNFSFSLM